MDELGCSSERTKISPEDGRFEILEASVTPPSDFSEATLRRTRGGLEIFAKAPEPRAEPEMVKVDQVDSVDLPSDGIEVTEEEYEYPEKDADAAEGWFDVRGDFQLY